MSEFEPSDCEGSSASALVACRLAEIPPVCCGLEATENGRALSGTAGAGKLLLLYVLSSGRWFEDGTAVEDGSLPYESNGIDCCPECSTGSGAEFRYNDGVSFDWAEDPNVLKPSRPVNGGVNAGIG